MDEVYPFGLTGFKDVILWFETLLNGPRTSSVGLVLAGFCRPQRCLSLSAFVSMGHSPYKCCIFPKDLIQVCEMGDPQGEVIRI